MRRFSTHRKKTEDKFRKAVIEMKEMEGVVKEGYFEWSGGILY